MKSQIFSRRNVRVSLIGFLLLVTATSMGCGVFVYRFLGLDPVSLTQADLHKMGLTKNNRIDARGRSSSRIKESSVIAGFQEGGSDALTIQYWLFDASSTAKKAAADQWTWTFAAAADFQPERNPDDVIGDATWRNVHRTQREWEHNMWEDNMTDLYFVKYNLLVSVRVSGHGHLKSARDVARHIEAKIAAVLEKK